MTFRIYLKPLTNNDVEIFQNTLPTDRGFIDTDKTFEKKDDAIIWILANCSVYVVKEET